MRITVSACVVLLAILEGGCGLGAGQTPTFPAAWHRLPENERGFLLVSLDPRCLMEDVIRVPRLVMSEVPVHFCVVNCTSRDVWLAAIDKRNTPPLLLEICTRTVSPEGQSVRAHHQVLGGVMGPAEFYRLKALPRSARGAFPCAPYAYEINERIPLDVSWHAQYTDVEVTVHLVYYAIGCERPASVRVSRTMRIVYENEWTEARPGARPPHGGGSAG